MGSNPLKCSKLYQSMFFIDNNLLFSLVIPKSTKFFILFTECSLGITISYFFIILVLITYNVYGLLLQKAISECLALVLIMSCYLIYNDDLICLGMFKGLGPYVILETPWKTFNDFLGTFLAFFSKFLICLFSVAFFLSSSDSSDAVKEGPEGPSDKAEEGPKGLLDKLKGALKGLLDKLKEDLKEFSDWLKEIPKNLSEGFKKCLSELSEKLKEELKKLPDKLRNLWEIFIKLSLPQLIIVLFPYYLWLKWVVVILTWPKIIRLNCLLVFLILAPSEPFYAYPITRLVLLVFLKFLNTFCY